MERYMGKAGFIAGATAGVVISILQWAAYLVEILPYQIYAVTASIVFPSSLAYTIHGYLLGFLGHTAFSGLLGLVFAYAVRHRARQAVTYGAAYGVAILVLLSGFFMPWLTAEQPFWRLAQPALYFTIVSRLLFGTLLGYLYRRFILLPAARVR